MSTPRPIATGIRAWYSGREPRERRLLCLCALAIAAFVIWLGLYRPLLHWNKAQVTALSHARSQHLHTAQLASALAVQPEPARILEQWRDAANAAGLGISQQSDQDGLARLQLAPAPAAQVLRWLDGLPSDARPLRLQLERNNGLLQASLYSAAPGRP